jgi:hypothetical protein
MASLGHVAVGMAAARWGSSSHGIARRVGAGQPAVLDSLTNGARRCALFWPFDGARHFMPFHPIPVAPIGLAYWSRAGLRVALVEIVPFAPVWLYAVRPRRKRENRLESHP